MVAITEKNDTPKPGFYVAWGPWLDIDYGTDSLYKVGHTGDLRARLSDDCYNTCFPPGHWRYIFTIETLTKNDAFRLETGVLTCAHDCRLGSRELVRMQIAAIKNLAAQVAKTLGVVGTTRDSPVYPVRQRKRAQENARVNLQKQTQLLSKEEQAALSALKVRRPKATTTIDDYIDDLIETFDGSVVLAHVPKSITKSTKITKRTKLTKLKKLTNECFVDTLGVGTEDTITAPPLEDRAYQTDAIKACLAEMRTSENKRAILQMACRCGKTRVAHGIIQDYCERNTSARILFLVPGLALLRQTVQKLDWYGMAARVLLVGSDTRTLPPLKSLRPCGPETTDSKTIADICRATVGPLLVASTYQSSPNLLDCFDLIVFDECHRTCGDTRARPFSHVLLNFNQGHRLYMTATPRYDAVVSMKNRDLYGGVAYAYHLREGIDAGYVNDFCLELVGAPKDSENALVYQILTAMKDKDVTKLLIFCKNIKHATELLANVQTAAEKSKVEPFICLSAHSRMRRADIEENMVTFGQPGLRAAFFNVRLFQEGVEFGPLNAIFYAAHRHSARDIIQSNCRPLNAMSGKPPSKIFVPVVYDSKLEPEDPKNLKGFSSIVPFFDALIAEDPLLYEHLLDPKNIAYPLRWVDSAAQGLDKKMRYDPDALLAAVRRTVRRGTGKTERLLRAASIPWDIGFGELERVVKECGRYTKTTDCYVYHDVKINFNNFYKYVRVSYAKWQRGEDQPLEPHQLRALESLPGWDPYGIKGPYPWEESLKFFAGWLRDHSGKPPMVEINKGGYVGLEATMMERLSGVLTCVNQSDGRDRKTRDGTRRPGSGFTLSLAKQKMLDDVCRPWGIRWRKDRLPAPEGAPGGSVGSLKENDKGEYIGRKTFIQAAFARFKAEWYSKGKESEYVSKWFKNYPTKHQRQERADVWARRKEVIPPRWRKNRRIKKGKTPLRGPTLTKNKGKANQADK